MTECKLTDDEVLSALERCILCNRREIANCDGCLLEKCYPDCDDELEVMCLDLINRQKAEIELLQNEIIKKNHALLSIRDIAKKVPQTISDHCSPDFDKDGKPVNVWKAVEGYKAIDVLVEQIAEKVMA